MGRGFRGGGQIRTVVVVRMELCGRRGRDEGEYTKYHPVLLPVVPNSLCEERTMRIFG